MTYNKYYLMILYHLIFKFDYFLKKFDKFKYILFNFYLWWKKINNFFAFNERINNSFFKNIGVNLLFVLSSINFLIKKISTTLFVPLVSSIIIYLYSI